MIEALNKVIKHQFLLPYSIASGTPLERLLAEVIPIYNKERPQYSLGGNTPFETYNGTVIDFSTYTGHFMTHKANRLAQNRKSACTICR